MIPHSSQPERFASWRSFFSLAFLLVTVCLLGGCATTSNFSSGTYHVNAYAPTSPGDVQVYVSLRAEMVYVMEGNRPLMVTPVTVGTSAYPTPTGHFRVTAKDATKRSGEYGFWVNGNDMRAGSAGASPGPGYSYVGYPMAYWVEFAPGFGFHEGYVWPQPHSHGCLRLNRNASVKFYKLVQIGTPITIAESLPEDDTIGRNVEHPTDYRDPDPPAGVMISPSYFSQPRDSELLPQPAQTSGN
ncbi:MAG: L,D-transpeptidase [Methylacidiphilales bacterium]|nr:L,D-transpeptidase [Candidatus Methylacidiphilales bacterium]